MKSFAVPLFFAGGALLFCGAKLVEPAKDFVVIDGRSTFSASTSAGDSQPDRVAVRLEVNYGLAGANQGTLSLALDERDDLQFSTYDHADIKQGSGAIALRGAVRVFGRDTLHGLVLLTKANAAPGEKPLALATLAIDLRHVRSRYPVRALMQSSGPAPCSLERANGRTP